MEKAKINKKVERLEQNVDNSSRAPELNKVLEELKELKNQISMRTSFALRASKSEKDVGLWTVGVSIAFLLSSPFVPGEVKVQFVISIALLMLSGAFFCLAGALFEVVFTDSEDLSREINKIGGHKFLLFGKKWWEQWKAGVNSKQYRRALILESVACILMLLSFISILLSFLSLFFLARR